MRSLIGHSTSLSVWAARPCSGRRVSQHVIERSGPEDPPAHRPQSDRRRERHGVRWRRSLGTLARLAESQGATPRARASESHKGRKLDDRAWAERNGLVTMAAMVDRGESRREDSLQRLTKTLGKKYNLSSTRWNSFTLTWVKPMHTVTRSTMVREYGTTSERQKRSGSRLRPDARNLAQRKKGSFGLQWELRTAWRSHYSMKVLPAPPEEHRGVAREQSTESRHGNAHVPALVRLSRRVD